MSIDLNSISLAGAWSCELDPLDVGITSRWFARSFTNHILLPGTLPEQGLGDEVTPDTNWTGTIFDRSYFKSPAYAKYRQPGNIKVPFWLQPDKYYVGAAWYQREIEIPGHWSGKRVILCLERPHWQTRVWLDGCEVGSCDSLSTPHEITLGKNLSSGRYHLTVRVDNRLHIEVGENAHSVTDHTQGNWNGIVGHIELRATEAAWIEELTIHPHVESRSITVRGKLSGSVVSTDKEVILQVMHRGDEMQMTSCHAELTSTDEDGAFEAELTLGNNAELWDEFHPALYVLKATFAEQTKSVVFGMREFSVEGTQCCINGRKVFLRGALDCCIYPLTGHPPMDAESWLAILRKIKAHGFNHVRFHSWCPPEAAFIAGDELGVYFQIECATWPNSVAVLAFNSPGGIGDGHEVDRWTYCEAERIMRVFGNHPCFVLMACGNEPGGAHHKEYLSAWVSHFRNHDSRRLYTAAAGWPELSENQFHVIPNPRIHQWGDGLNCRINSRPPATIHDYRDIIESRDKPVISHEIGQWCAYPPLYDVGKYRGYLKARNYEIFAEALGAHHMADQARDFVHASGRLQALCYKEEIESALRTPGMAGFQLLGLQDFSGQGTSPVGLLDVFWEEKGYLAAAEMRRFCNSTVPLARLKKRVFVVDEPFEVDIEVAHYGSSPMENAVAWWELKSENGATLLCGKLPVKTIPIGNAIALGSISVSLDELAAPARYKLVVRISASGEVFENDWDVWLYPRKSKLSIPMNVSLVRSVREALTKLEAGHNVLLIPPLHNLRNNIALGFSPIFWNTACTQGQAPHTLGILCDPKHPAFAEFPTDAHSNWQWWYLIRRSVAMVFDEFPFNLQPIVQVVDDWFTNRKLGLLFEAKVARGKLVVCSIDLCDDMDTCPVARQFLQSIVHYVSSSAFQPTVALAGSVIDTLINTMC